MTAEYDFPKPEVGDFTFAFAALTPEQADQKRAEYETFQAEKAAAAAAKKTAEAPATVATPSTTASDQEGEATPAPKKVFKPVIKKKSE